MPNIKTPARAQIASASMKMISSASKIFQTPSRAGERSQRSLETCGRCDMYWHVPFAWSFKRTIFENFSGQRLRGASLAKQPLQYLKYWTPAKKIKEECCQPKGIAYNKQCNLTIDFLYKVKTAQNGTSTDESTFPPEAAKRKSSSTTNLKTNVKIWRSAGWTEESLS